MIRMEVQCPHGVLNPGYDHGAHHLFSVDHGRNRGYRDLCQTRAIAHRGGPFFGTEIHTTAAANANWPWGKSAIGYIKSILGGCPRRVTARGNEAPADPRICSPT